MPEVVFVDVLETCRKPADRLPGTARRVVALIGVLVVALGVLAVAFSRGSAGNERGTLAQRADTTLRVAVLGDSSAGDDDCPGCFTYSQQLAAGVHEDGTVADLDDHSWSGNVGPSASLGGMIGHLRADPEVRRAVAFADIIVLAMGDHDLRLTGQDSVCQRDCVKTNLDLHRQRLRTLLTSIHDVRRGRPALLRLITVAPVGPARVRDSAGQGSRLKQPQQVRCHIAAAECDVITRAGGECINLLELARSHQLADQDVLHTSRTVGLTQHGHDIVGRELLQLGLARH